MGLLGSILGGIGGGIGGFFIGSPIGGAMTGASLGGKIGGSGKKDNKKDPYANLLSTLQPYLDQNKKISEYGLEQSKINYGKAGEGFDTSLSFLTKILEGSNDDVLKALNIDEITDSYDAEDKANYELGVRGGRRAGNDSRISFDRSSAINKIVTAMRGQAPERIAQIAQAIANMAQGQLNAGQGANTSNTNLLFGIEQLRTNKESADSANRNQLLGSIFSAAGSVAGVIAAK